MKWIKYQIAQENDEEIILLTKKVGYSEANLAIAGEEAYNGQYTIEEDGASFEEKPLAIEFGGTNAKTPEGARANIGAAAKSKKEMLIVPLSAWAGNEAPYTAIVDCAIATADNKLIVGVGGELTVEQHATYISAMVVCTGQAEGSITLSAFGNAPEIDLPVNVVEVD